VTTQSLMGDMLCLAAGLFWALTTLIVRLTPLARAAPEKTLLYELAVSAPLLFAGSYLLGERLTFDLTPSVVAAFTYTVVIVVVVSYSIWFWLLQRYPARSSGPCSRWRRARSCSTSRSRGDMVRRWP
jgi:drug/metabolite transporter (DMT)-like permease